MKPIAFLAFLSLLAMSLWLLLSTHADAPTNITADPVLESEPTPAPSATALGHTPRPATVKREETLVLKEEEEEASPGSFLVTVIRADTEEVMPDFEVTWLIIPKDRHYPYQEWDSVVAAKGIVTRTNAEGQLRLSQNETNMLLIAKGQGLYGRMLRSYRVKSDTLRLQVLPDQSITVNVKHADGTPAADYRVSYAQRYAPDWGREYSFTRTNENGIGILEHIQIPLASADVDHVQSILIGFPNNPTLAQDFSLSKALPTAMEFLLPAEATVRVVAEQYNGKPFPDGTKLYLQRGTDGRFNPDPLGGFDMRLSQNGLAEFPVGLNLSLEAALFQQDNRKYFSVIGKGPTRLGETVEIKLIQEEAPTYLTGRLLNLEGKPLPNVTLRGRVKTNSMSMGVRLKTDSEGKFQVPMRDRKMRKQRDDDTPPFRFLFFSYLHPDGIQIWCHLLDLGYDLEPGENDMGDIQLSPDLIASGIVVDSVTEFPLSDVDLRFGGSSQTYHGWSQRPVDFEYVVQSFLTNPSGRFEVHGNLAIDSLQTPAEKPGYLPNQFALTHGAAEQILPLVSGQGMRVRVLLDPGISHHDVRLVLKGKGERQNSTWGLSFAEDQGEFITTFLPVGDFDLSLTTELEQTIFSIDGIHVEEDSPQDPRLDPIDLRGLIFQRTIHVTGVRGDDPDFFMIATESDLSGTQKANHSITLTPSSTWSPHIWADSREAHPMIQSAETVVQLQPAMQGVVRFTDPPSLPEGAEVTLQVYRKEDYAYQQSSKIDLNDSVKVGFRTAGTYALQLEYRKKGKYKKHTLLLDNRWQATLEVLDSSAVQEFSFQLSLPEDE